MEGNQSGFAFEEARQADFFGQFPAQANVFSQLFAGGRAMDASSLVHNFQCCTMPGEIHRILRDLHLHSQIGPK